MATTIRVIIFVTGLTWPRFEIKLLRKNNRLLFRFYWCRSICLSIFDAIIFDISIIKYYCYEYYRYCDININLGLIVCALKNLWFPLYNDQTLDNCWYKFFFFLFYVNCLRNEEGTYVILNSNDYDVINNEK